MAPSILPIVILFELVPEYDVGDVVITYRLLERFGDG